MDRELREILDEVYANRMKPDEAQWKINILLHSDPSPMEEDDEPYMGWCEVEGCNNEGANGGGCWPDTGYWIVCSKHASQYRAGEPQPKMKQEAVVREKTRDPKTGYLPDYYNRGN